MTDYRELVKTTKIEPLKQKNKRPTIGYLTTDWAWGTDPLQPNGCAWYRCVLPGAELEKRGWVCGVGIPGFNQKDGFGMVTGTSKAVHGWDIIVLKLVMNKEVLENMDSAIAMGQKIVVDVDDFFDGLEPTNRAFQATDPKSNPNNNREIYAEIIKKSFAIITSTQFLYDYYSKIHKNVFMVRNSIDSNRYTTVSRFKKNSGRTRIGWVGATPWRSGDLEELSSFIGGFIENQNFRFHHSGHVGNSPTAAEQLQINTKYVTTSNLSPISDYPKLFKSIEIGIVPLRDVPFNHAKSWIKGLEYAASAIPFVASPSPEYEELFNLGIGRIARNPDDWMYHFSELKNKRLREDEAAQNMDLLQNFTIYKRADEWEEVMTKILEQEM